MSRKLFVLTSLAVLSLTSAAFARGDRDYDFYDRAYRQGYSDESWEREEWHRGRGNRNHGNCPRRYNNGGGYYTESYTVPIQPSYSRVYNVYQQPQPQVIYQYPVEPRPNLVFQFGF
jgi:hypothetical protein